MVDITIPLWLYPILIWTLAWKAIGAWKAARNGHLIWFVSFFVFNTIGILPIVYLVFFQNMKFFEEGKKKVMSNYHIPFYGKVKIGKKSKRKKFSLS